MIEKGLILKIMYLGKPYRSIIQCHSQVKFADAFCIQSENLCSTGIANVLGLNDLPYFD